MIPIRQGEGVVYGLFDKRNPGVTRYIGSAECFFRRHKEHVAAAVKGKSAPVNLWVRSMLIEDDREPGIYVSDVARPAFLRDAEANHIKMGFKRGWPLLTVVGAPAKTKPRKVAFDEPLPSKRGFHKLSRRKKTL